MPDAAVMAKAFEEFALYCRGASPLYERLSLEIAGDEQLLKLAAHAGSNQPAPNLLFAAVRFLLFKGYGSGGLEEFQSMAGFRSFCRAHVQAIQQLLHTRRVQTNEVGRCSYLLPAFVFAAQIAGGPLALIEVGTSAGLLLNWDRYGYKYDETLVGDLSSPVQITCELRGEKYPPLPTQMPTVATRLGIDPFLIDLHNDDEVLWLQSLIWPEQVERAALLTSAIGVGREHPISFWKGDALEVLPDVLASVPADSIPCVFHTAVLYQFPAERQERFSEILREQGSKRDLVWISGDLLPFVHVGVTMWRGSYMQHHRVARAHFHGQWLEWLQ